MMNGNVAVIVAHPDDEVLGCGGTIAKYAKYGQEVRVLVLTDGESSRGQATTVKSDIKKRRECALQAAEILGVREIRLLDFPDNQMDKVPRLEIVQAIEDFVRSTAPSTVLTHYSGDLNIDHRITQEAVLTACRPQPRFSLKQLMFFEVPSSTEWRCPGMFEAFDPNVFVDISETFEIKLQALDVYCDELRDFPHARSRSAIESLLRWRGGTVGVHAAEAFVLGRRIE